MLELMELFVVTGGYLFPRLSDVSTLSINSTKCMCVYNMLLQTDRKDGSGKHSKDDNHHRDDGSPMKGGSGRGRRDSHDGSPDAR